MSDDTPNASRAYSLLDRPLIWISLIFGGATLAFMTFFSVWNVLIMRKALNDYVADRGVGPDALSDLVDQNYIRFVPDDPVAGPEARWRLVTNDLGDIVDIHSSSDQRGSNETPYSEW